MSTYQMLGFMNFPGKILAGPWELRRRLKPELQRLEEGALADLLSVDGDPLQNLALIADPAKNFVVIMKDGKVYKNLIR